MPVSLTLPPGYYIQRSRDGFALHSDHFGEIGDGDFGCWASACYAAHDHVQSLADAADRDAASEAYEAELDRLHGLIRDEAVTLVEGATGRARAIADVLAAIDAIGMPAASAQKAA